MEELNAMNKTPDDRSSGVLLNLSKSTFLLFGGGNRVKTFNDFWILTVNTTDSGNFQYEWCEIKPLSNFEIYPRFGMCGVALPSSENNNLAIWVHGGQNYFESKHFADLLNLEVNKNEIKIVKNQTTYPIEITKTPCERNSHAFTKSDNDTLFIFGGGSSGGLLNDLWKFSVSKSQWTKCEIKGENIPAREMHGMIYYENKSKQKYLYIIGGRLYESICNKIYRIDISNDFNCEYVTDLPISLCSFSYSVYKHFLIIYGGTDGNTFINDIIIFNISNQKWARSKFVINSDFVNNDPNLSAFLGRIGSMMSIDEEGELLIIFGGSSLHKDTNYLYTISLKELLDENNLIPFQ